ncbi:MAG: C-type lectin domain-containing protein [Synergistaceae bacterium]|nr:C-type lectin domain-containing protein [Synergistaceae bacterium]
MKRKILALMFVMLYTSGAWGAYYDEGNDGDSWDTAYLIRSAEDLKLMRDRINDYTDGASKYYKLTADIDMTSETDWYGIGYPSPFGGHLDGMGHKINIDFNLQANGMYGCLFVKITQDKQSTEPSLKNLKVEGNVIDHSRNYIGGIVATLDTGTIESCDFHGTLEGTFVGGFVGRMNGGKIKNCTALIKFVSLYSSATIDYTRAGGFVDRLYYDEVIENCTILPGSEINGYMTAGGIVCRWEYTNPDAHINNCSTSITLHDSQYAGGIVGYLSTENVGEIVARRLSGNTWPSIYPQVGNQAQTSPDVPVENPTYTWNNHKYQIFQEALTWDEAKSKCEELGGHLATITSSEEQNIVAQFVIS